MASSTVLHIYKGKTIERCNRSQKTRKTYSGLFLKEIPKTIATNHSDVCLMDELRGARIGRSTLQSSWIVKVV